MKVVIKLQKNGKIDVFFITVDNNKGLTKRAKRGQNGSKWCFWAKGLKRPKKAKNREKMLKFGQKW